jgi:hypothetical protein
MFTFYRREIKCVLNTVMFTGVARISRKPLNVRLGIPARKHCILLLSMYL